MNNVIVNNKPRPVVPAPLVIGRTQSVFSFGGFSLWRDETLDKEIKSAQERHANEIERYKEKAKAWDELTSYTHSVFLDTNIFHNNESAGLSLDEVVSICKEKGWEVTVSTLAVDELKHQVKVKDRSEKDAEKGKRAEIALSKIKELSIKVLDGNRTVLKDKFRSLPGSAKQDRLIEQHLIDLLKEGQKIISLSDDGDYGVAPLNVMHARGIDKNNYMQFNTHRFKAFVKELNDKINSIK